MLGFLYRVLNQFLDPVAIAVILLIVARLFRRRPAVRRLSSILAVLVLAVCGNRWVVEPLIRSLEWRYLPPQPMPTADAIVILSGAVRDRRPPRPALEVNEAGDRVIYGAQLFRQGRAPQVFCTGGVATGSIASGPEAVEMGALLEGMGVPSTAIVLETAARNTHEHPVNLCPMFAERNVHRVLLVTSAMHMPRSVAAFQRACPAVEYIAAPTDFQTTEALPAPWYRSLASVIPTSHNLVGFLNATHEYVGILYYRIRGWI